MMHDKRVVVIFGFLTTVYIQIMLLWFLKPCRLMFGRQNFGGT
jgi:hypothetical protein